MELELHLNEKHKLAYVQTGELFNGVIEALDEMGRCITLYENGSTQKSYLLDNKKYSTAYFHRTEEYMSQVIK